MSKKLIKIIKLKEQNKHLKKSLAASRRETLEALAEIDFLKEKLAIRNNAVSL